MSFFGLWGGKTFDPKTDIPDLSGKVALVTGGNTGIGKETILQLAKHNPARIYLAARTESKALAAIKDIKVQVPDANVIFLPLDLSSLDSVRNAVKKFSEMSFRLDLLIENAGIMAAPPSLTSDSYEIQIGTNHIGHALLAMLLMPTLLKTSAQPASDVRIVCLSSSAQSLAPKGGIVFSELETPMTSYSTWTRYGQSKAANILFAAELARRHPSITSVSVHPGFIDTELKSTWAKQSKVLDVVINGLAAVFAKSVAEGAKNSLWAATAPKGEVTSGSFYYPVGSVHAGSGFPGNEKLGKELWEWTEGQLRGKAFLT